VVNLADIRGYMNKTSPAFIPYFKDKSRYQVLYGGAGSGKSHKVARVILQRILKEKHNYLIVRKVDRTIKRSVFALMKALISQWGLTKEFSINLTDKTIIYKPTNSQIIFSGLDDVEKTKIN